MNNILIIIFSAIILISLAIAGVAYFSYTEEYVEPLTVKLIRVEAPEQTEAEWPESIHDPSLYWIDPPEGVNLAEGKQAKAEGGYTEVYAPMNATDGIVTSYWESAGFPGIITVDLEDTHTIQTLCIRLNPSALWEARSQEIEVLVSTDGNDFVTVVQNEMYGFDPDTGNIVIIDLEPVSARFVRLIISSSTANRTRGAQIAELMIFS